MSVFKEMSDMPMVRYKSIRTDKRIDIQGRCRAQQYCHTNINITCECNVR